MATDAATLLAQAKCYACFMEGERSPTLMELALVQQWALNASGVGGPNLIPPNSHYDINGFYSVPLVLNGVYHGVWGSSTGFQAGGFAANPPTAFNFTNSQGSANGIFQGTPGALVTDQFFRTG